MTKNACIAFVGGDREFPTYLVQWLRQRVPEDEQRRGLGPVSSNNVLSFEGSLEQIKELTQQLESGDQPNGLRYAQVSLRTPEEMVPRFVKGTNITTYDKADKRMAQAGRKVGMTPHELAEVDGW